ncbi:hypothetical protein L3X38_016204 [Prunus dulcis]|uniref:non-specific serine/threonine protein kinase n=1 Tax=Prunus dulcis TaxID=3755 RepID=A0AAD4W4W5_PRUDU|nr:hypothetical protein L3X38_016204 [Prunus dulcis]
MSRTVVKLLLFTLLLGHSLMLLVHGQDDQSEFISIDCGLQTVSYTETKTKIRYISDANFIDTGESKSVLNEFRDDYQQPYWSLRSFPEGTRNCYNINVTSGIKYLIRASFLYGNYDGQEKVPEFELHLGANLWESIRFENASVAEAHKELIHVPLRSYIHVCLVKTGSGVPFISAIELRPLPNASYPTQVGSLALEMRFDTGQVPTDFKGYRYPFDVHDRFWYAYDRDDWTQLSTSQTIDSVSSNNYQPPPIVMRTAATPRRANASLDFLWLPANDKASYYVYIHFAEVEKLRANQSRLQYITRNGRFFYEFFAPDYLYTNTILSPAALSGGQYNFSIRKAENSTLPPILNAIEIYTLKEFLELETNQEDVDAINNIKSTYKIKKNWQGDPCAPQAYLWEGVKCSYPQNESPRIISLDLSSSGLTGEIATSISNLIVIQTLDLSNNNLTGPIPDFLSQLPDLNVINLEKNKLTGSVPVGLIERRKNGFLSLSLCANPNLSGNVSCKKKRNFVIPVVASVAGISILLLSVAALYWGIKRKRQPGAVTGANPIIAPVEATKRQFTYSEILQITNNLKRILGKGGFGTVYHGCIDKTQVAVKMLSPSSVQGLQQFHAEVNLLMRVHHINLTRLVGYCNDENHIGLVYEYMENGNLQAYLSDSTPVVLTWEGRLQIATDAAQGLEYLHYCCSPPMIHRDVKSTNILLNEYFQAKLSDFGLSRNFPVEDGTHILTGVAGTPGYLAPEYNMSNRLNEKSDVYSFGVVLLEIIAGRPAFINTHERIHISKWVGLLLPKGDIYSIVDPRLERRFNVSSVWKAVELAMACVSKNPINRPSMSQVLVELKECLATELARTKQSGNHTEKGNSIEMMSQNSIAMLRPSVR